MEWPIHRRRQTDTIAPLVQEVHSAVQAMADQVQRLGRLQYKGTGEVLDALKHLQEQEVARDEARAVIDGLVGQRDAARLGLLRWIDMLDALETGSSASFDALFAEWRADLVETLGLLGLEEIEVLGRSFDARVAEALGTLPPAADRPSPPPYSVVRVLRRGFRDGERIYRKAHVVTIQSGPSTTSVIWDRKDV